MDKITLKQLLKNPANVILVFIFVISLFVGSLFIFRIVYHKTPEATIAMKELDDSLIYYISKSNDDSDKRVALILDGRSKFNLILNNEQTSGFTGTYVQIDNTIYLYTNYYYNGKAKNDYKVLTLNVLDDSTLILNYSLNNIDSYELDKVSSSMFKSNGFNNLSVSSNQYIYTYLDSDNETISNNIYSLDSIYSVIKFIDRYSSFLTDNLQDYLYSSNITNKYGINQNQILNFIIPNINDEHLNTDIINNFSNNIFKSNIPFDDKLEILSNGYKYVLDQNRYVKNQDITDNKINNVIKRIYNYQMVGQRLTIDEILIAYECSNDVCRFYPFTNINDEEKNYYDFTTSSIDIDKILLNIDKINHYTWTFINENNQFCFESLELN